MHLRLIATRRVPLRTYIALPLKSSWCLEVVRHISTIIDSGLPLHRTTHYTHSVATILK